MRDGGPEGTFVLTSEPQHLARLRDWLRGELTRLRVENEEQFGLQVAVGEICSNSIRHAYAGLGGGLRGRGVKNEGQWGLRVAVGEICSNSIRHAYAGLGGKPIHVSVQG